MRAYLPATLLLSALLAACASNRDTPINKHMPQSGALKTHPGLLGQPVPVELQELAAPATTTGSPVADGKSATSTSAATPPADTLGKIDQTSSRARRSLYFDYNSTSIRIEFVPSLQEHVRYLAANPKSRLRIEGNADERGSPEHNARLGLKRAETVRQALIAQGAQEKQITIKSLGEARPKLKGHDEESWAENRRADVIYEKDQ